MLKYIKIILITIIIIFSSGCHSHDHNTGVDEHEHPAISVTQYTSLTEIFMEYPSLSVNTDVRFLIHLTDLTNFKAVKEGVLQIEFSNENGVAINKTVNEPTRPGIYIPTISFAKPGTYTMKMNLSGNQVSDQIIVNNIIVYASMSDIPHTHEEESSSISFLKEQQWKIEFANESVLSKDLQESIIATGEINPKPEFYSKVVSPVSGIVLNKNNINLRTIGTYVTKGSVLLYISPTVDVSSNIQKIKNDFLLAQSEFERIEKLYSLEAVSKKRFDEAKFDFEAKKVSYNSIADQIKITDKGYSIVSPISGYIQEVNFLLGSHINTGEELFTIINPLKLILEANIALSKADIKNNSTNASFKVEGINEEFVISELGGRKLST
jgi:biotin carboxyl carrier protein